MSSAERFRRAESAEANCSPVGVCAAGTQQVVCLDGERETAQAVRAAHAERPERRIGRRGCGALETFDGVVDLHGDVGPTLSIVGLRQRKDELAGQARPRSPLAAPSGPRPLHALVFDCGR